MHLFRQIKAHAFRFCQLWKDFPVFSGLFQPLRDIVS